MGYNIWSKMKKTLCLEQDYDEDGVSTNETITSTMFSNILWV